ncbi:hypothetical protein UPYG_G00331880 [Umbra pygmaea]|uniref:XK-related protein n=1 Tax=Umbra pygmaea TaxID=75934 RepID=A0ABD0VWL2_UMBPY
MNKNGKPKSWCQYACSDLFNLGFYVLDMVLNVWTVVTFYQEEAYVFMGVFLFIMLGSSAVVQAFSWLWFLYDKEENETRPVSFVQSLCPVMVLHLLQMGMYLRYVDVMRVSKSDMELYADYMKYDLGILRYFETFLESVPQVVLMTTFFIQNGEAELITILKTIGSVSAIAVSLMLYHRYVKQMFFSEKQDHLSWGPSVVYFLWNLFLVGSRVGAVALFASVFPCFIAAHFLSYWMVLCYFAWRLNTDFMEGAGGECLYRATIGVIWYFNWFNVIKERSRWYSVLYHIWMGVDIVILCGLWVWQMKINPPYFALLLNPEVVLGIIVLLYLAGLGLMMIYYKCCHLKIDVYPREHAGTYKDNVVNERLRNLAENFYYTVDSQMPPVH